MTPTGQRTLDSMRHLHSSLFPSPLDWLSDADDKHRVGREPRIPDDSMARELDRKHAATPSRSARRSSGAVGFVTELQQSIQCWSLSVLKKRHWRLFFFCAWWMDAAGCFCACPGLSPRHSEKKPHRTGGPACHASQRVRVACHPSFVMLARSSPELPAAT